MTQDIDHLGVQLYEPGGSWVDVGVLHRAGEHSWFESTDAYWNVSNRPVLGQVFEEHGPGWKPDALVRLPRWFSHLLPEGRLREAVAESAGVKSEREFFLLARIGGDDLPGGVRVFASNADGSEPDSSSEESHGPTEHDLGPLKFSLAGVQLKFSVRETNRGLTIPTRGQDGDWIVKLPDLRTGFEHVPEAEFAGLELARASGIRTAEARLVDVADIARLPTWATVGGGQALAVRRFDRTEGGGRVHVEELAQVLNLPTGQQKFKYNGANFETVARATFSLCGTGALEEVIDRIVLNVLIGNGDAHAKNWAYTYPDGRHTALSPAYDIVPTVLYVQDDDLGLNLARSKSFERVRLEAFERLAEKAGSDGPAARRRAEDAVQRVLESWPVLSEILPVEKVTRLTERRDALLLAKG